jgi:CubicO group peptidase (beta-lactamase class C family)
VDAFKDLMDEWLRGSYFTHVYAEAGYLEQNEPKFVWQHLPDGQNIFDLASITKALSTTPLVFFNFGKNLDSTVGDILGEQTDFSENISKITLSKLLRHEAGFPAWRNFYVENTVTNERRDPVAILNAYAMKQNAVYPPLYSDLGFILLGFLLERVTQKDIAKQFAEFRVQAFGENSPEQFLGTSSELDAVKAISCGYCPVRQRILRGEVHDENAWALGGFAGHSGLFATGSGLSKYLKALWRDEKTGKLLFEANAQQMTPGGESLMGWRQGADASASVFADGFNMGHMGFTGTAFWVDPKKMSYVIFLTNRIQSGRVSKLIAQVRRTAFAYLANTLS